VHAIALDSKYGVPTIAIHTNVFEKAVQSVTRMHGMPEARYTFVPQPVMGKTAEQLRAYVDGKSPISGRPVMQEVIEGLTRPAEGNGVKETTFARSQKFPNEDIPPSLTGFKPTEEIKLTVIKGGFPNEK